MSENKVKCSVCGKQVLPGEDGLCAEKQPLSAAEIEELRRIASLVWRDERSDGYVMRRLPRLLAMLTPPAGRNGERLSGVSTLAPWIESLSEDYKRALREYLCEPPTDAAVREAVEVAQKYGPNGLTHEELNTLVRAAQAPRLTGEQVEAVDKALTFFDNYARMKCSEQARGLASGLRAAFPELGEVPNAHHS